MRCSEKNIKKIIEEAGAKYIGIQKSPRGGYALFEEPKIGSTLMVLAQGITVEKVKNRIKDWNDKHKGGE